MTLRPDSVISVMVLSLICIKNSVCPDSLLVGNSWQTCDLCSTSLTPPPLFPLYTFPCCASCDQQCEVSSLGAGPALLSVVALSNVSLWFLKLGMKVIGYRVDTSQEVQKRCHTAATWALPAIWQPHSDKQRASLCDLLQGVSCPAIFKQPLFTHLWKTS